MGEDLGTAREYGLKHDEHVLINGLEDFASNISSPWCGESVRSTYRGWLTAKGALFRHGGVSGSRVSTLPRDPRLGPGGKDARDKDTKDF